MPLTIRRSLIDRVRQSRKIAYAICAGLTLLVAGAVFVSISSPGTTIEVAASTGFFDADRAYRETEAMWEYVSETSAASGEATNFYEWFKGQLPGPDMASTESFEAPMGDETVTLQNIQVALEGVSNEVILIVAPRDIPTVVKVEGLTYTSGTGVLLELIQVFAAQEHQKTLVFLSTEDSGNGGLGINHFLESSTYAPRVSTILSFHGLGKVTTGTDHAHPLSAGITSARDTTPGWLLQLVGEVLRQSDLELEVPGLWRQAAERAMAMAQGDQIAGLTRGIPSLRLYDDSPGNPNPEGLAAHGPAIETLILSLDAGAELPTNPGTALLLKSGRYLTNGAVTFLAVLCLFPTLAALVIWLFAARISLSVILRHLRNLASFALPLVLMFLMAYFLSLGGLIPRYRLQVPSEGAGAQPRIGPTLILIVIGVVAFIISRRFLGYFRPRESRPVTEMAKLSTGFFGVFLGLILIVSRSPFAMLPCVGAAWAWPLTTCFAEPVYRGALVRHRLSTNLPLLLLGLAMPIVFYSYVSVRRGVGWLNTWWFLLVKTMSGAYGLLGPVAMVFIVAGFAVLLGVRRMRVVPIESLDVKDELSMLELPIPRARRRARDKSRDKSGPRLSPWG